MEGLIKFIFIRYLLNIYTVPALVVGPKEYGNKQDRFQAFMELTLQLVLWGGGELGYTTQQVVTVYALGVKRYYNASP